MACFPARDEEGAPLGAPADPVSVPRGLGMTRSSAPSCNVKELRFNRTRMDLIQDELLVY